MSVSKAESLPTEIQMGILKVMPSAKALHSLIRASPRYLSVFLASKKNVLSELVYNVIGLEALPDALVAASESRRFPRGLSFNYLEGLLDNQAVYRAKIGLKARLPISTSVRLLKLDNSISYHMTRFVRCTLRNLQKCSQSVNTGNTPASSCIRQLPLYSNEETRLRRAFYRLDLYCYLFHSSDRRSINEPHHVQIPTKNQEAVFLAKLPPWEIEELACVWQYLRCQLGEVFDELEDAFVTRAFQGTPLEAKDILAIENREALIKEAYRDRNTIYSHPSDSNSGHVGKLLNGRYDHFFTKLAKRYSHDNWIEYLSSMGLVFLRELFDGSPRERLHTVIANRCHRSDVKFLTSALNVYGTKAAERHEPWIQDMNDNSETCLLPNASLLPNEGFKWARKALAPSYPCRHKGGLRSLGYAIWDTPRLVGVIGAQDDIPFKKVAEACQSGRAGVRKLAPSAELRIERLIENHVFAPIGKNIATYLGS